MRRLRQILVLALLPVLLACGHTSQPAPRVGDALQDWPTYHFTNSRSGWVTTAPTGPLTKQWAKPLTGSVYGEPLVVGSTLVVATGQNHVYGLDARTGTQLWDTTLGTAQPRSGLPCGNIDPLGVLGTPAYDAGTGSVFVVAETVGGNHTLWALAVTDGAKRWSRSLDTQPDRNKLAEQQRGATMVVRGHVITTFGGLTGDCQNYVGYVTSVPVSGVGDDPQLRRAHDQGGRHVGDPGCRTRDQRQPVRGKRQRVPRRMASGTRATRSPSSPLTPSSESRSSRPAPGSPTTSPTSTSVRWPLRWCPPSTGR